jgi:hypothetical protein
MGGNSANEFGDCFYFPMTLDNRCDHHWSPNRES